ncbi:hypothetical protein SK355_10160 [Candidatus Fukatsuia symbiotica]|uniref:Uncharacterized protein n=1 Tax=Candidatus Fukatsuia symbiotica TaxID=1878942 RepID=A0A2U8I3L6_9GAMM|nr:hypothetical protein [Candidatus Fukatsuia symbiotica]AWK13720.1 hypothetical protein CCS41_03295 [Candidatus Fukatsuia symbiotica]MEA9445558.1 hypothetical protein [Candidatus Fukatsuia symbiotica]
MEQIESLSLFDSETYAVFTAAAAADPPLEQNHDQPNDLSTRLSETRNLTSMPAKNPIPPKPGPTEQLPRNKRYIPIAIKTTGKFAQLD